MTSQIDHLVLGAEDLSFATQALESDFGVPFNVGGEHPVMAHTTDSFVSKRISTLK